MRVFRFPAAADLLRRRQIDSEEDVRQGKTEGGRETLTVRTKGPDEGGRGEAGRTFVMAAPSREAYFPTPSLALYLYPSFSFSRCPLSVSVSVSLSLSLSLSLSFSVSLSLSLSLKLSNFVKLSQTLSNFFPPFLFLFSTP